jgi:hypothetical protein
MAAFENYSQFVAFYTGESAKALNPADAIDPNLAGAALAVGELSAYGIGTVFVPKTECVWDDEPYARGFMTEPTGNPARPLALQDGSYEIPFGKGGVQAVRSRTATPGELQGLVPVVNDQAVREIGSSKARQATLFAGLMPTTVLVKPDVPITARHLDPIKGDTVAISLDNGDGSQLVLVDVKKSDAAKALDGLRAHPRYSAAPFVVQEVERGVRFNGWGDPQANHEVRVVCFADRVGGESRLRPHIVYHENAGAIQGGVDRWLPLPIDQDHDVVLPYKRAAEYVVSSVLIEAESPGALIAVDLFQTEPGGRIRLRGVHTRDPIFADRMGGKGRTYQQLRAEHSRLMAHQLATLALGYAPDVR